MGNEESEDVIIKVPQGTVITDTDTNLIIADLNKRISDKEISIVVTPAAKDYIVENGYDPTYGARPLKRYVQKNVETLLARKILAGEVQMSDVVTIDVAGGQLTALVTEEV